MADPVRVPRQAHCQKVIWDTIAQLPKPAGYDNSVLRSALETIISGPDSRGGTLKAQAIHAAAQLHDRLTALDLEAEEQHG